MNYEEYLTTRKRIEWLKRQEKWHKNRKGNWHTNQANFYRRKIKHAWNLVDFNDIVGFTIRHHSKQIIENISISNLLLSRLR